MASLWLQRVPLQNSPGEHTRLTLSQNSSWPTTSEVMQTCDAAVGSGAQ
jgi:hypothetical protein